MYTPRSKYQNSVSKAPESAPLPQQKSVVQLNESVQAAPKPGGLREEFVRAMKVNNLADRTIEAYCDAVRMLQNFLGRNPLNVSVNDLRAFFLIC
jgi:hypothetical protein